MSSVKHHEADSNQHGKANDLNRSIGLESKNWVGEFLNQLEHALVDTATELPDGSSNSIVREFALRAVLQIFFDIGTDATELLRAVAEISSSREQSNGDWTEEMNARRFTLIDGEIQGNLTITEQIELARLTQVMRQHVDSEMNVPVKGARELHRRLLTMQDAEKLR